LKIVDQTEEVFDADEMVTLHVMESSHDVATFLDEVRDTTKQKLQQG